MLDRHSRQLHVLVADGQRVALGQGWGEPLAAHVAPSSSETSRITGHEPAGSAAPMKQVPTTAHTSEPMALTSETTGPMGASTHLRPPSEVSQSGSAPSVEGGLHLVPPFHRELVLGVAIYALGAVRGSWRSGCRLRARRNGVGFLRPHRSARSPRVEHRDRGRGLGPPLPRLCPSKRARWSRPHRQTPSPTGSPAGLRTRKRSTAILSGAARILAIGEDATAAAMRLLWATTHNVAEPPVRSPSAGLVAEHDRMAGKRVAVIQTGGNVDSDMLVEVLGGGTPTP